MLGGRPRARTRGDVQDRTGGAASGTGGRRTTAGYAPGVVAVLPMLKLPALPCRLAVHREIRGNAAVQRVWDFLAAEIPRAAGEA
jgi:hypothetical protein